MSNRFHTKYHRHNHHTYPYTNETDSSHDPIASPTDPFNGDFVLNGMLSAAAPASAYSGLFRGTLFAENLDVAAITSESVLTDYLSAIFADIDVLNIHWYELSGLIVRGIYNGLTIPADAPATSLILSGAPISGNSWASFVGDIKTNENLYVKGSQFTTEADGNLVVTPDSNQYFNIVAPICSVAPNNTTAQQWSILSKKAADYPGLFMYTADEHASSRYAGSMGVFGNGVGGADESYRRMCSIYGMSGVNFGSYYDRKAVVIDVSGNLGVNPPVGTTNFESPLTVYGDISSTGTISASYISMDGNIDMRNNSIINIAPCSLRFTNDTLIEATESGIIINSLSGETIVLESDCSNQWNSSYNTLTALSGNWETTYTAVCTLSSTWGGVPVVSAERWDSNWTTVNDGSGGWDSAYNTTSALTIETGDSIALNFSPTNYTAASESISGNFSGIDSNAVNWNNASTVVIEGSSDWDTAYAGISGSSFVPGDKIAITYSPVKYVPETTDLSGHLNAIDSGLSIAFTISSVEAGSFTETDQYLSVTVGGSALYLRLYK